MSQDESRDPSKSFDSEVNISEKTLNFIKGTSSKNFPRISEENDAQNFDISVFVSSSHQLA